MITQLIDGVRELRKPLACGYIALYIALLIGPTEAAQLGENTAFDELRDAVDGAGSGTRFALLSVVVALAGGLVVRLIDKPLSWGVSKLTLQDEPFRHMAEARSHAVAFDAEAQPGYAALVRTREEQLDRHFAEFDFRITLVWLLSAAALATGLSAGGAYWLTFFAPIALAIDCHLITSGMRSVVSESQRDAERAFFPGWAIATAGFQPSAEDSPLLDALRKTDRPRHSLGRTYIADPEGMPLRFWQYN